LSLLSPVAAEISPFEEPDDIEGKSPLPGIHRVRINLGKHGDSSVEVRFRKNLIRKFLLSELLKDKECFDIKNGGRPTKCRCIGDIKATFSEGNTAMAIDYCYGYALLSKKEQQTLVIEWVKYSETINKAYMRGDKRKRECFLLPGTQPSSNLQRCSMPTSWYWTSRLEVYCKDG
jgi:hypothetical protein